MEAKDSSEKQHKQQRALWGPSSAGNPARPLPPRLCWGRHPPVSNNLIIHPELSPPTRGCRIPVDQHSLSACCMLSEGFILEKTDTIPVPFGPTMQGWGDPVNSDQITTVVSASRRLKNLGSNPGSIIYGSTICDLGLVFLTSPRLIYSSVKWGWISIRLTARCENCMNSHIKKPCEQCLACSKLFLSVITAGSCRHGLGHHLPAGQGCSKDQRRQ